MVINNLLNSLETNIMEDSFQHSREIVAYHVLLMARMDETRNDFGKSQEVNE